MNARLCPLLLVLYLANVTVADDPIFSGPQKGERLPGFQFRTVFEDQTRTIDFIKQADGKPVFLIFVHKLTRPSVGLTRLVMNYAAKRAKDGLVSGVVWLTADPTETEARLKRARRALPTGVPIGIYTGGEEGPGSYGLNRMVTLTVLVAKDHKVTANFALVQPSVQADVPRIMKEVVAVLGGGKVPSLAELGAERMGDQNRTDPKLRTLIRPVIQKDATPEQVDKAATAVEAYVKQNRRARRQLGEIAQRIVASGRLKSYGTERAQEHLKTWAKNYAPKNAPKRPRQSGASDERRKKDDKAKADPGKRDSDR